MERYRCCPVLDAAWNLVSSGYAGADSTHAWLAQIPHRMNDPLPDRPPDFLVIGAQKAGTTWLYLNLMSHPGV